LGSIGRECALKSAVDFGVLGEVINGVLDGFWKKS
jgi:hypothetical protein